MLARPFSPDIIDVFCRPPLISLVFAEFSLPPAAATPRCHAARYAKDMLLFYYALCLLVYYYA